MRQPMFCLRVLCLLGLATVALKEVSADDAQDAENFLKIENDKLATELNAITVASWNLDSDITDEHQKELEKASAKYDQFKKDQRERAKQMLEGLGALEPKLKRQFEKMIVIGTSALPEEDAKKFQEAMLAMTKTYSTAKVNVGFKTNLELEPHLTELFALSENPEELREAWYKFRDATGRKMRDDYNTYIDLGNKAATLNSLPDKQFKTFDDLWMFVWESDDIKEQVTELMKELNEFYVKIHAYVRFHLTKKYPNIMPADGTIPAHLLGNMWAQDWGNLLQTVREINPHPDVQPIDEQVNQKLQAWSVKKMFTTSDDFFQSLGMDPMTDEFWEKSILEKPPGIDMVCHASAWDFYQDKDFRIKQCTDKTLSDLQTVHHEMGHIQYFMQYREQATVYRDGGNPGFHEAIGDLIALSVVTPKHLNTIGLFDFKGNDEELKKINLNYQMKMALEKVAFLPFSFVMDKWRWDVFSDANTRKQMNKHWWELRLKYQGLSPPMTRSEKDFDPGAKYHIPAGVEYVRYFVSHVLQFQFFEKMCSYANPPHTDEDLYTCDFANDKKAGAALMELLKAGSSDSWEAILKKFIGTEKMSLSSLKKYFTPLIKYLDDFIQKNNIKTGWDADVSKYVNDNADFLEDANKEYREWSQKIGEAQWAQNSNINDETTQNLKEALAKYNEWRKDLGERAKTHTFPDIVREKRQFEKFAVYGTSALSGSDGVTFTNVSIEMKDVYGKAKVIIDGKEMSLEPELVDIMATKTDETLLKDVWIKWHNASGSPIRSNYITFYELGNKAAKMNEVPGKKFETFDDLWMFEWESPDLKKQIDTLMDELKPLYEKIHAYVRYHLKSKYKLPEDGTIPAHLLGNMWAQQWGNLLNLIPEMNPAEGVEPIDASVNKKLDKYTPREMFDLSDKFFIGLGMEKMTDKFWEKSIIEKQQGVEMICHASAWDFYDLAGDDFRIKQCTEKTMNDLVTVHHEMGHIQYYMNYKIKEPIFRRGGNPGFHEAIGDLIALSVSTPKHLKEVGLYEPEAGADMAKINLNYQMKMALDKIAFLPFAYVMDKWRWEVFGNPDLKSKLNRKWWELRIAHQGVSPPVRRNEREFDPGAKYHIPANTEYVRYFVSHVLQFQFFEQMCKFVGDFSEDNLYECDFDGNKDAGAALRRMLMQGSSDQWPNILEEFTHQRTMSLDSLKKYFGPLDKYLDKFIQEKGITPGWNAKVDDYMEGKDDSGSNSATNVLSTIFVTIVSLTVAILFM